jgi:hypothetical protein
MPSLTLRHLREWLAAETIAPSADPQPTMVLERETKPLGSAAASGSLGKRQFICRTTAEDFELIDAVMWVPAMHRATIS